MGGVLARFQVTRSDDKVWQLFSGKPFEQIKAPPAIKLALHDSFFFEPQPAIKRVIFIATPHRGSSLARNILGKIGNCLVTPSEEILRIRDEIVADNPGVFNLALTRHLPTSVADLAAGSPILDTMQKLPFDPNVRLHSIVGYGKLFPLFQPGDGYVPFTSAHLDGVESELLVKADHTMAHKEPESVREVKRILWLHLREVERTLGTRADLRVMSQLGP